MEFTAIGVALGHNVTTLREMRTNAVQPLVQPNFTARLICPCERRRIRNSGISRSVGPFACADRQTPGITRNCRSIFQIPLGPENENRIVFPRWGELIQI